MKRLAILAALVASPALAQLYGLTPVVSAGAVDHLVAKAVPGTAIKVEVTNLTSTAGFLIGYNAISNPSDGSLTAALVIDCVTLPASGTAVIDNQPGPGTNYTVGITYILTSAATCYTKTTGTVTGFISAKVQ
jgi:hypothetical protein